MGRKWLVPQLSASNSSFKFDINCDPSEWNGPPEEWQLTPACHSPSLRLPSEAYPYYLPRSSRARAAPPTLFLSTIGGRGRRAVALHHGAREYAHVQCGRWVPGSHLAWLPVGTLVRVTSFFFFWFSCIFAPTAAVEGPAVGGGRGDGGKGAVCARFLPVAHVGYPVSLLLFCPLLVQSVW